MSAAQRARSDDVPHAPPALNGRLRVPGDKSISHRSLIFGLLTVGETRVEGLLEGADVLATARGLPQARRERDADRRGPWRVRGVGVGGLLSPAAPLDFGNAGTGSRLMMGVVAGHGVTATFDGDASLRKRPMMRVLTPLLPDGRGDRVERGGRAPAADAAGRRSIPSRSPTRRRSPRRR